MREAMPLQDGSCYLCGRGLHLHLRGLARLGRGACERFQQIYLGRTHLAHPHATPWFESPSAAFMLRKVCPNIDWRCAYLDGVEDQPQLGTV
jgi:hypothetical protein